MAFDKTVFFMMAMYESPIVPVSKLRKDFFPHLSLKEFVRRLKSGEIPMPMIEMGGDEFSPYGIHVQDAAAYIDKLRAEGQAAYERGELAGIVPSKAQEIPPHLVDKPHSPESLAQEWGVSVQHIRDLIRRDELPHFKVGRLLRIPLWAVREFEARRAPSKKPAG